MKLVNDFKADDDQGWLLSAKESKKHNVGILKSISDDLAEEYTKYDGGYLSL